MASDYVVVVLAVVLIEQSPSVVTLPLALLTTTWTQTD